MKVLLIDVNCKDSSTGRIVYELYQAVNKRENDEAAVCYGRGKKINEPNIFKFGLDIETYLHALFTRLTGYTGCFSTFSTLRLIRYIKKFKPDVVHIHELHAYFVNIKPLINFLKKNKIKTVMTLHCEFIYTGKCGHSVDCKKWMTECGGCPHLKDYPATYIFDHTKSMFKQKKELFKDFDDLTVVTPSRWLADRAKKSFLKDKTIYVIHNGINTDIFTPQDASRLRKLHQIKPDERVVLSLAPDLMNENKGGRYVLEIARKMKNENIKFIMIGVEGEIKNESDNVIIMGRISDKYLLAQYYSLADVFLICSKRENFPTTCLEAQCCGTPVCGFDVGGVRETIIETDGLCRFDDVSGLIDRIRSSLLKRMENTVDNLPYEASKKFGFERMAEDYFKLYQY